MMWNPQNREIMMERNLSVETKQNKEEAKNTHDSRELCTRSTGLETTCP
jgi:hypothetical protein